MHELISLELQNVHIIYKALKDLIGPIGLKHKCSDVLNKSVFTRISTVNAFCLCVISFLLKTHIMLWNLDSHPTQVQLKTRTVLKLAVTEMVSLPLTYSTFSLSPHYQSAPLSSNYTAHSSLN